MKRGGNQQALKKRVQETPAVLQISGAQGEHAMHVNGLFWLMEDGELPVWKHNDQYLYFSTDASWTLGNHRQKDARQMLSHTFCSTGKMRQGLLPTDVCNWSANTRWWGTGVGGELKVRFGDDGWPIQR